MRAWLASSWRSAAMTSGRRRINVAGVRSPGSDGTRYVEDSEDCEDVEDRESVCEVDISFAA